LPGGREPGIGTDVLGTGLEPRAEPMQATGEEGIGMERLIFGDSGVEISVSVAT
jgi:hypothetical protein